MDIFRTPIPVQRASFTLQHTDQTLLIGSCFTEHIGRQLRAQKFPVYQHPFGIVYNPISMADCLERLLAGDRPFQTAELFNYGGLWHSWAHHGQFSSPVRETALQQINTTYQDATAFLQQTNRLLLTFGTADIFTSQETGQVVANNHKVPIHQFTASRLSVSDITRRYTTVLQQLKTALPDLQVILTVSPVRHVRQGMIANQRSKATLVLACAALCEQLPFVHYFPAYELLLDDLRDYRFYATDMLHPSEAAVAYVWKHFEETYFSAKTKQLNQQIGRICAAAGHRPFHRDTPEYQAFAQKQLSLIEAILVDWPALDFKAEQVSFGNYRG